MTSNKKAYTYALIAVLFWSTAGSAFKLTLEYFHPYQLLLVSSSISFLALLVLLITRSGSEFRNIISPANLKKSAVLGFLNPFLYYVILFTAYSRLPAQEAMALNYLWPLTLVLLSIPLLKQRITLLAVIAIMISFSGTFIIGTRGDLVSLRFSDPPGVSLAIGSSLVWALYWIFNLKDKREPHGKLLLNFFFGTLYVIILMILTSPPLSFNWRGFAGAGYIGLFEMGFTFFFWLLALKHSDTTARISNLVFLSPFLSLIFISVIVGELILPSTILGLALIIAGVLVQHYFARRAIAVNESNL